MKSDGQTTVLKEGSLVMTHAFGPAAIVKIEKDTETQEIVVLVRPEDGGVRFHLTPAYVRRLPSL